MIIYCSQYARDKIKSFEEVINDFSYYRHRLCRCKTDRVPISMTGTFMH